MSLAPPSAAPLPDLAEIRETLTLLDDWEERLGYVLDLGRRLPPLAEAEKTPATKVDGCMSQVWLKLERDGPRAHLRGDSDAQIPKGLLAVLAAIVEHTPDAAALDLAGAVRALGLEDQLTPNRRGGLVSMIQRIEAELRSA